MKSIKDMMLLYAVTDRAWTGEKTLFEQAEAALKGGITCLQLREKELDEEEFLREAIEMKKLCSRYDVPLIINDNVEIALRSGADGVHAGQSDMRPEDIRKIAGDRLIIGTSASTPELAVKAQQAGADYLGVGAVFSTSTKLNTNSVSYETLSRICSSVTIPVTAIGGIKKNNIMTLAGSGADGAALVSAIFAADDIEAECRELLELAEKMTGRRK